MKEVFLIIVLLVGGAAIGYGAHAMMVANHRRKRLFSARKGRSKS